MNEKLREKARDLLEEGIGPYEIADRLEVSKGLAVRWKREFSHCHTCDSELLTPTGICVFCEVDLGRREPV